MLKNIIKTKGENKVIFFLVSQVISTLGSSVVNFSIYWYLALKYKSGTLVTFLTLCTFVPQILITLFSGVWADKYNKKTIIMLSDSFIAFATLIIVIFILTGNISIPLILLAVIARSIGTGIQNPAILSVIPEITNKENLMKVNGLYNSINSTINLISPILGGIILGSLGLVYALLFDVITAIIGVGILSFIKISSNKNNNENFENKESEITQLKLGLKYIKNNLKIKEMLKYFIVVYILVAPAAFIHSILIVRIFGENMNRISIAEMIWSLGLILGGLIFTFIKKIDNKVKIIAGVNILIGIDFFIMGITRNFFVLLATLLIGGMVFIIGDTTETVFIQENTQQDMRGRVFSILNFIRSVIFPLAILFFGPLADKVNIQLLIAIPSLLLSVYSLTKILDKKFINLDKA